MGKGQSFLCASDRGEDRHLHVIITIPDDKNIVLTVPICTYNEKPWQDSTCILPAGCHPFVKKRSYINYQYAKEMSLIDIFNCLRKGIFIQKSDFDMKYVQDMQKGAEETLHLPEKMKRFFEHFF